MLVRRLLAASRRDFAAHHRQQLAPFATQEEISAPHLKAMDFDNISSSLRDMKFDVRGVVYQAALKRQAEGKPVLFMNVGNPHELGQAPLTFLRQVLAAVTYPALLLSDASTTSLLFPSDASRRARKYIQFLHGGVGAYSDPRGNGRVIEEVEDFLENRDGIRPAKGSVFLTNGASEAVRMCFRALLSGSHDRRGVLTPVPQYPLYTASIALNGGEQVGYDLDEAAGWGLSMRELERSLEKAEAQGIDVCALVFINPGNPTGQCLSLKDIEILIEFSMKHGLVLIADEVYQENVYESSNKPFMSARSVMRIMGEPYTSELELISLHSISKGSLGEGGMRGGFFHLENVDPRTIEQLFKLASVNICPNVPGQVALGIMVNPPRLGDESFALFQSERRNRIESLGRRAKMMTEAFNSCEGISCQAADGAMYLFPSISLPRAAVNQAYETGFAPDEFYCLRLLDATGISTTPGSGFSQVPGSFHIRVTILPPEDQLPLIMDSFKDFHQDFMDEYRYIKKRRPGQIPSYLQK